jgi:Mn-dependent DtxR family transcriptional regulator
MPTKNIRDGLLIALVLRYEQDHHQFLTLSKQTVDSSSARLAIAELRNQGWVEEQVRGVIRLTELGYEKYKNAPLPYAYAG